MSVFPQRQFNGVPGEPSVDTGGPDMIERDLDEINKMFNPNVTHTGGEQGGISKGNLNFTITNDYDNTEKAKVATAYTHAGTTNANPHATKAGQIDNTTIAGVVGTNVQSTMEGLKSVIDTKETIENVALKESIADANLLIKTVTFASGTGTFTFTTQGGTVYTIDTDIEKVPGSMALVEDPVGSGSYYLVLYDRSVPPVELSRCPVSTLFNPINVEDTNTIDLTLTTNPNGSKTLKADIRNASITMAMLSSSVTSALEALAVRAETAATNAEASETNASTYATNAGNSATAASNSATSASGYATNASNSANQSSGYATTSQQKATLSESYAKGGTGARTGEDIDNAKYYKEQTASALVTCQQKATLSESWAVGGTGTRTGEDTNNAKYWAEQASILATGDMKKSVFDPTGTVESAGGISSFVGQEISVKENTSNKVTAFQSVPDDAHYPSEKLVKDSLDTKIEHIECFVQNDTLYLVGEIFQVSGTTLIIS